MLYNGRIFTTKENTSNGEVDSKTIFHYFQDDNGVWGEYAGGEIVKGFLVGFVSQDNSLLFNYVHTNTAGIIRSGTCTSVPEILPDGRLLMHEKWQWLNGDRSKGESLLIEIL